MTMSPTDLVIEPKSLAPEKRNTLKQSRVDLRIRKTELTLTPSEANVRNLYNASLTVYLL